jgi:hypothetical protein
MKQILLVTVILSALTISTSAQINVGVKVGTNVNKISGVGFSNSFSYNYLAGGFVAVHLGKKWQIQPEVIFTQNAVTTGTQFSNIYSGSGASAQSNIKNNKLNTLAIPIVLRRGKGSLSWEVGAQYSKLIDNSKNLLQNGESAFKNGDLAAIAGINLKLPLKLNLNARYLAGLNNLSDLTNTNAWRSQSVQVSIGLRF